VRRSEDEVRSARRAVGRVLRAINLRYSQFAASGRGMGIYQVLSGAKRQVVSLDSAAQTVTLSFPSSNGT